MDEFKDYLKSVGLSEKSVKDDMSRIKSMEKRNVDYTKGEQYAN